jgi:hypothetical protein
MVRRRWLILPGLVFVGLIGSGVYLLIPPKPGVTRENFRCLHKGMSQRQVAAILGSEGKVIGVMTGVSILGWKDGEGDIWVHFDGYGAYEGTYWGNLNGEKLPLAEKPEGVLEVLHRWFGL